MITSLRLQNFKSWPDTDEMRLAPITGLFGANSSGKSSILQFLLMLTQTAEVRDRTQVLNFGDFKEDWVRLGTFRDVIYRDRSGKPSGDLEWSLEWILPQPLEVEDPTRPGVKLFSTEKLKFHAIVGEAPQVPSKRLIVKEFEYEFLDEISHQIRSVGMEHIDKLKYRLADKGFDFQIPSEWKDLLPAPINFYAFPDQVVTYYQNSSFLRDLNWAFDQLFENLYYLGPFRQDPQREYPWAGSGGSPEDIGKHGEYTVAALLASREEYKNIPPSQRRKQPTVEEQVASWLQQLNLISEFRIEEIAKGSSLYRVRVRQTLDSPLVLLPDVGFGVSQVLPVLTLCAHVPQRSTILLEEPELHLHPSAQAGLADIFIDVVKRRNVQIILESHSEHLLARLQRRIAEEQIREEEVALYFCETKSGTSHLRSLELNKFGYITNWPKDFFGDDFGERAAMMEATIKRQERGEAA